MQLKIRLTTTLLLFLFLILLCFPPSVHAMKDTLIAIVNDETITFNDLSEYLHAKYMQLKTRGMAEEEINKVMLNLEIDGLNKLIEDKLILNAAIERGVEVKEEAIDNQVEEIKERYPSEQIFLNALTQDGSTVTDLRDKVKEQMLIQYIVELDVRSKIFVNPQEVTAYYDRNVEKFKKPERVDLDSIVIFYSNNPTAARQRADEAMQLIKDGKDFTAVAKQYSNAPPVGILTKDQMLPEIEKEVSKLLEGGITYPIETDRGIFIFKLRKKIPPEIASLDEVKDGITNMIFQEKFQKRFRRWIDGLKKNAYIEIKK